MPTFRVNDDCTCCAACEAAAPRHFEPDDARGAYRCAAQPSDARELARCRLAKESCPVEAIEESPAQETMTV